MKLNQAKKKEKIILAAMVLFAKKGFAKTSMADIAKEAGIGKGTTYEYFKGKDELFFATFEWFLEYSEKSANVNLSNFAAKSSIQKIRVFSESVLQSIIGAKEFYPLTIEFWSASGSSKFQDEMKILFKNFYQRVGLAFTAIIEEGVERGEFDSDLDSSAFVPAIVGAWDMIGLQAWFDDEFDIKRTMNAFTDLIIRGLLKK
jgi:AcrR family transcriptional regulator